VITVDEWAEIRRLHRSEGLGIKAIARKLGASKNTVRRALRADEVPRYRRAPKGSIVDEAEPAGRTAYEPGAVRRRCRRGSLSSAACWPARSRSATRVRRAFAAWTPPVYHPVRAGPNAWALRFK
jgi:transposase